MSDKKIPDPFFHIVLVEPEIPNNTGNIGRTCIGCHSDLHLVGKLGFEISDKKLKRAGLDYWVHLDWYHHKSFEDWLEIVPDKSRIHLFTTKTDKPIFKTRLQRGDWLVFGKETKGLSREILDQFPEQLVTLPMYGKIRSLNLANAVTAGLYEGIRQLNFD
jgi:tRNA (cytidine/uridine-2'-O-)-methyltransferase